MKRIAPDRRCGPTPAGTKRPRPRRLAAGTHIRVRAPISRKTSGTTSSSVSQWNRRMPARCGFTRNAGRYWSNEMRSTSWYAAGIASNVLRENSHTGGPARLTHALDGDVDLAAGRGDPGDELLIGRQRVGEPAIGTIADPVDARGQPVVEHDEQLPGKCLGRPAVQRGVQELRRHRVVALAGGPHEAEQRAARCLTPERIASRFCLRCSRRGRRRLRPERTASQHGQQDKPASPSDRPYFRAPAAGHAVDRSRPSSSADRMPRRAGAAAAARRDFR